MMARLRRRGGQLRVLACLGAALLTAAVLIGGQSSLGGRERAGATLPHPPEEPQSRQDEEPRPRPIPQRLPWYAHTPGLGPQAPVTPPANAGFMMTPLNTFSGTRVVRQEIVPRFLDHSAFAAARTHRSSLSFYRAGPGGHRLPAPCPLVPTAAADERLDITAEGRCWRAACATEPLLPQPCFGGCRCPIGPCRVVSFFNATSDGGDIETLHCVDSSELYADPGRPFTASAPPPVFEGDTPHVPSPGLSNQPLMCPALSPGDALPTFPHWVRRGSDAERSNDTLYAALKAAAQRPPRTASNDDPTLQALRRAMDTRARVLAAGTPPPWNRTAPVAERIAAFQHATAWHSAFPRWERWGGRCVSGPAHEGSMRGYHSHKDGFYRLENVCIGTEGVDGRSTPLLSGYRPELEEFEGTDEMAFDKVFTPKWPNHAQLQATVNGLLRTTRNRRGAAKDECFLDTDVVLFPPTSGDYNDGHLLRIVASTMLLLNATAADPTGALVLYANDPALQGRAHTLLAPLLSRRAGFLFTQVDPAKARDPLRMPVAPPTAELCFRSVVIPHACRAHGAFDRPCHWGHDLFKPPADLRHQQPGRAHYVPRTAAERVTKAPNTTASGLFQADFTELLPVRPMRRDSDPLVVPLGNQYSFRILGQRRASDLLALGELRRRIARCLGVELRRAPRTHRPHVVYALRTRTRWDVSSVRLGDIAQLALDRGAGRFTAIEYAAHDPATFLRYFIDADVLWGPFGSGITWQFVMPPGAAAGTFNIPRTLRSKARKLPAWNRPVATDNFPALGPVGWLDFPGDAALARTSFLVGAIYMQRKSFWTTVPQLDAADLPGVVDALMCALRAGYWAAPAKCPLPQMRPANTQVQLQAGGPDAGNSSTPD